MSIREEHDPADIGNSVHEICFSIPCRLPVVKQDSFDGHLKHDLWTNRMSSSSVANVRDAAKQLIDFGMESSNDELFRLTVRVFTKFSLKIIHISEDFYNLNLCRIILISSPDRASRLRSLGYNGKLVLIVASNDTSIPPEIDYSLKIPYSLRDVDTFLHNISSCQTLSTQPNFLTTLDCVAIVLRPHQRIPIVSWFIQAMEICNKSDFNWFSLSRKIDSSQVPVSSAYTPVAAHKGLHPSTSQDVEEVDYDYLTTSKIVASTVTAETSHIADNYVMDSFIPYVPFSMQCEPKHMSFYF